jgi:TrmH family RNA methyltransferase
MQLIHSKENERIKLLKKVYASSAFRKKTNLTILDGIHLFESYLKTYSEFDAIFCTQNFYEKNILFFKHDWDTKIFIVDHALLRSVSSMNSSSDFMVLISKPNIPIHISQLNDGMYLYLKDIQDPGNVGSIFRAAQAAGNAAIFLSKNCVDAWSPKTLRGSQGFQFNIPIVEDFDINSLIASDLKFLIADMSGQNVFNFDFPRKTLLILGNEGVGVRDDLNIEDSISISIPMFNNVESLNVALASGLISYQYYNQFKS